MGQIGEQKSSVRMAKKSSSSSSSAAKSSKKSKVKGNDLNLSDPKVQGILLVGLLALLALALWFGFTRGCMRRRRRRRSC